MSYSSIRATLNGRAVSVRVVCLLLPLLIAACSGFVRTPLPASEHLDTTVLGQNDLRYWGDDVPDQLFNRMVEDDKLEEKYSGVMHREHNYLVISGGGANGAYGAGVLTAWSELETRPEFTIVTGISTGALSAPFAFLGSAYDEQLKNVYTTLDSRSIFQTRNLFSLVVSDSLFDTTPLRAVLEKYVNDDLVAAIAREYRRGRRLEVGTTNLDAGRPVVWDITKIAATGSPGAAELIREILLASASLPGLFPPVYIEVEAADGQVYDEMHVDGGAASQMFFYPEDVNWSKVMELLDVQGKPSVYMIRNSRQYLDYKIVQPRLLPIAGRTIGSLIRTQGIGDFYRIYSLAQRDGLDVNITWIPQDAVDEVVSDEVFDPDYMKALFEFGYQSMHAGAVWVNATDAVEN